MNKRLVSTLLAIFLTVVVVAPTLISIVDNTVEVGLFETSEEEKDTRGENKAEIEKLLTNHSHRVFSSEILNFRNNLGYCFKVYPKPHLNLISPPPELV